ncbi:OmpA family protein [Sulfuriroseicoccus oceanibius]|uniref:OmpA family protein n=1 Tax=Sulfuriroseicoccus oceanibius TaxID=2707525 RepID=A0A6B3L8T1_9BACT|nr:OmpA family protein [Sulfuriroseicoccus oceanibius]QQL46291.1 OmpA family protein [Sulfuriroseicoccus oceanibius]
MRLDTQSTYRWQNVRRRDIIRVPESRVLRWWIIVALVFSILVHLGLFMYFGDLMIPQSARGDRKVSDEPVLVQRVELDQTTLDASQRAAEQDQAPDMDLSQLEQEELDSESLDAEIDLLELQEMIPDDREIAFSPEFEEPANLAPAISEEASAAVLDASLSSLETTSVAASDDALNALETHLSHAPEASDKQMAINLANSDSALSDQKDLMDQIRNAADRQGRGDALDGFATLDQLVNLPGGKLTDASKPIYMPTDLLFDFGEHRLRETAKTSLMMLGVLIDRNPDTLFVIDGHTDTIGSEESNMALSLRRANAVKSWLVEALMISPARIQTRGLGETKPIVSPTGDADAQQPNRRVEIQTVKKDAPVRRATPVTPAGR